MKFEVDDFVFSPCSRKKAVLLKCNNSYPVIKVPKMITISGKQFKVTKIGNDIFSNCHILKIIHIPTFVKQIGDCCFRGSWIETIIFEGNSQLQSIG